MPGSFVWWELLDNLFNVPFRNSMKLKFIHILETVRSWLHSLDWLIRKAIIYLSHRALAFAVAVICTCTCKFLPVTVFALLVFYQSKGLLTITTANWLINTVQTTSCCSCGTFTKWNFPPSPQKLNGPFLRSACRRLRKSDLGEVGQSHWLFLACVKMWRNRHKSESSPTITQSLDKLKKTPWRI